MTAALAFGGCVYPRPPDGQPVPDLVMSSDQHDPVSGLVTFDAMPLNFAPNDVEFRLDKTGGPPLAVAGKEPYSVSIDTSTVTPGTHTVWATASDGTYTVTENESFTTRPNFVVVLVDDMDSLTMPLWDALPKTKAAIGDRGTTFTNSFAPNPVCVPARASLLTGKYPHNHGVFDFADYHEFVGGAENDTIATRLQAAGYRTAFAGKYLNGYESDPALVPPGWNEWFGLAGNIDRGYSYSVNHNGTMESYGTSASDYQTDVLSREATSFLNTTSSGNPFLLYLAPHAPHAFIPPAPRDAQNPFATAPLPPRPNQNEADVSDKAEWLRTGIPLLNQTQLADQTTQFDRMMGSMYAVDDMVSSVVSSLKQKGELASTELVFTSDNGFNFASHRLVQKQAPYEESIRVPLVMAGPGIPHQSQDALVTQEDLAPTILDMAGLPVPDTMDGRSWRPLFEGQTNNWRSDFLLEYSGKVNPFFLYDTIDQVRWSIQNTGSTQVPTWRAVRNAQYMYIQYYGGTYHDYELFDLQADPYELTNLLATPDGQTTYAGIVAQMQARLDALANCAGVSCR